MFHTKQSIVKLSLHAVISITAGLNEGAQTLCRLNLETRIGLPRVTRGRCCPLCGNVAYGLAFHEEHTLCLMNEEMKLYRLRLLVKWLLQLFTILSRHGFYLEYAFSATRA